MSEIDSDVVDNYSEKCKKSRNDRAKMTSYPTSQNASFGEVTKLEKISTGRKREKPKKIDEPVLEPRIPLPAMKRIRTLQTATKLAAPGSSKNSEQKG